MDWGTEIETHLRSLPLNTDVLALDADTETFFKAETGIQDTEQLRKHIVQVQEEAYKVHPYPCIRAFKFVRLKIPKMPVYPRVLQLLKNRPDAIFLDIGCCMSAEARKVIRDGWPMAQTIATDLVAGFWDLGHKLFRTTPETYPAKFLAGDVFDDSHLSPTAPAPAIPPPSVASVNTLTELRGRISVIHASFLFHLFGEERQFELAKRIATLLDPRPGSIIFGLHAGMPEKGQRPGTYTKAFCHSPESWSQLWEDKVFEKGQVKVTADLVEMNMDAERLNRGVFIEEGAKFYTLVWSIERL